MNWFLIIVCITYIYVTIRIAYESSDVERAGHALREGSESGDPASRTLTQVVDIVGDLEDD